MSQGEVGKQQRANDDDDVIADDVGCIVALRL